MDNIVVNYRTEVPTQLEANGFTKAQALAIYHHWVAPMDNTHRLWFLTMVLNMEIALHTALGMKVLVTSRGW